METDKQKYTDEIQKQKVEFENKLKEVELKFQKDSQVSLKQQNDLFSNQNQEMLKTMKYLKDQVLMLSEQQEMHSKYSEPS